MSNRANLLPRSAGLQLRSFAVVTMAALSALATCEATQDPSRFDDEPSGDLDGSGSGSGNAGGTDLGIAGAGGGSEHVALHLPEKLTCADNDQSLLIIDLRSGWWSGDGGDYHSVVLEQIFNVADPETNAPCNNISIEYHYFILGFTRKCIYKPGTSPTCQDNTIPQDLSYEQFLSYFDTPFDQLTQVWILSGSKHDSADLAITASFFVEFVDMIADQCMPMLLAADDCFIDHGNVISQTLGMGKVFGHEGGCPAFVGVSASMAPSITAQTTMSAGTHLSDHILFTDVDGIADAVVGPEGPMGFSTGDFLLPVPGLQTIATNTTSQPQIGEAFLEIPGEKYPRPILLDAGWDRMWTVGAHSGTSIYLRNLVLYMGLVGCIAEDYIPK